LEGTRALSLLTAPNINSYKRFASASWAPVYLVWSLDNRTCGFRIVGHGPSLRIENRFPGSDSNPYLVYAAVLALGLYGIERRIDPGEPFEGNGYFASDHPRVPGSLSEAIAAWEGSHLPEQLFGGVVARHYLHTAKLEQQAFDQAVTDWERRRYFERG
jgi:glutamine synthetase